MTHCNQSTKINVPKFKYYFHYIITWNGPILLKNITNLCTPKNVEVRGQVRKQSWQKTSRAFKAPVEKVNIVPFGIFGIFLIICTYSPKHIWQKWSNLARSLIFLKRILILLLKKCPLSMNIRAQWNCFIEDLFGSSTKPNSLKSVDPNQSNTDCFKKLTR